MFNRLHKAEALDFPIKYSDASCRHIVTAAQEDASIISEASFLGLWKLLAESLCMHKEILRLDFQRLARISTYKIDWQSSQIVFTHRSFPPRQACQSITKHLHPFIAEELTSGNTTFGQSALLDIQTPSHRLDADSNSFCKPHHKDGLLRSIQQLHDHHSDDLKLTFPWRKLAAWRQSFFIWEWWTDFSLPSVQRLAALHSSGLSTATS